MDNGRSDDPFELGTLTLFTSMATAKEADEADEEMKGQEEKTKSDEAEKAEDKAPELANAALKTLRVKVVRENGDPVHNAQIGWGTSWPQHKLKTNEEGVAEIELPDEIPKRFSLFASGDFISGTAKWDNRDADKPDPIPAEFTFKVRTGKKISGKVVDTEGEPIMGAKVRIDIYGVSPSDNPKSDADRIRDYRSGFGTEIETNMNGGWSFDQAPDDALRVLARVTHPEYANGEVRADKDSEELKQILAGTSVVRMAGGMSVQGTVTGPDGKPVQDVHVLLGHRDRGLGPWNARTDADGKYEYTGARRAPYIVTFVHKDFAPEMKIVSSGLEKPAPLDVKLKKGKPLRMLVVDEKDNPLPDVRVIYDSWHDETTLQHFNLVLKTRTDEKGELFWPHAPEEPVHFDLLKRDRMSARDVLLERGDETHKIVLYQPLAISGKVVGPGGKPLPKFTVMSGLKSEGWDEISWERSYAVEFKDGEYEFKITYPRDEHFLKVEAEGYRPAVSRSIKTPEGKIKFDFKLKRSKGVQGRIVDADGKPVKGAKVIYSLPDSGPYFLNNAEPDKYQEYVSVESQMGGQFVLPEQDTKFAIIVIADEGYARVTEEAFNDSKNEIRIAPWATVRGKCMIGDKPAVGETMRLSFNIEKFEGLPYTMFVYETIVKPDGTYAFTRVPPDTSGALARSIDKVKLDFSVHLTMWSHVREFHVDADETLVANIGGTGRAATGKVILPDGDDRKITEWNYGSHYLTRTDGPEDVVHPDDRGSYGFYIKSDGTFRAEDLPAGDYKLQATIREPSVADPHRGPVIGRARKEFTIPAMKEKRIDEPFDLGTIELDTD